ncbi:MAG: hypothetical protein LBK98_08515 [Peptococcaceae bacterium]|jgi:hypothetical protein|nr:hypothetical protein [Peptococcaceae bacterium]
MRALFWLWIMFLVVCLVTDSGAYWLIRARLGQSLELALDGALVAGVTEDDLTWGRNLAEGRRAENQAEMLLRQNMAGPLAESLRLTFSLAQADDRVTAAGRASVRFPFLLAGMIGRRGTEIVVNRQLDYQGRYK